MPIAIKVPAPVDQARLRKCWAGHLDANGTFVNPTIFINHGKEMITNRSLINGRGICPQAEEHLPPAENIRTLRAALNTLGDGFVEAVDDQTFCDQDTRQLSCVYKRKLCSFGCSAAMSMDAHVAYVASIAVSNGVIHGETVEVACHDCG
jgi:hypothetical protein